MTPKEMRAKRANLITQARGLQTEMEAAGTTEARASELEGQFDGLIAAAEGLETRALRAENLDRLEASLEAGDPRRPNGDEARGAGDPAPQGVSYRQAFHQLLQVGGDHMALTGEARAALGRGQSALGDVPAELRAQLAGTASAGGNLIPDEAMQPLVQAMAAHGPMFNDDFCRVIKTSGGGTMPIPGLDDTSNNASANTSEGGIASGGLSGGTDAVFSKKTLDDFMVDTGWLGISVQLATGAMADVESVLGEMLGERIGRKANLDLTVGTGSGQAQGIVTGAAASGVTITSATAITGDELLALYHSVDPAYRASPKFGAMFNDNTLLAVHKLKDGDGRYLVSEAPDGAGRIRVGGVTFRYTINQAMPGIEAEARSVVIGDFGKYFVRKIGGTVLMTARDSKFQPGFGLAAYTRYDGAVADARAIKALVHPEAS